jgi:CRP-like cAMP-binding protein
MENGGGIQVIENELAEFCSVAHYHEGEVIYSPCQQEDVAYFLKKGRVKLYHLDESGKRLTLAILGPGSLFGEMALVGEGHRDSSAESLEDSTCWVIEREKLRARSRTHPDLMVGLLRLFLKRMAEVQERLKEMVFKDLETRLARTLLYLIQRHGKKRGSRWEIALKITHQEVAELVGGTRENITMLLNRFEGEGLIAKQRYHIEVTDLERLMERAALEPLEKASEN